MKMRAVAVITLGLLVAACGDGGGGNSDAMPDGGILPDAAPSCLPGCAGDRSYDARGYALRGRFEWTGSRLVASEDITLTIGAGPVVELDSQVVVKQVYANGGQLAYVQDDATRRLRVDLTPLAPGTAPVTFTVDYEAPTSDSLLAVGPRDNDPVSSRIVFTDSEPDRGVRWLIAKHDPADRATFAVELTVAAGQDVIGNGERIRDEAGAERVVGYRIDDPIPTYLMAFAAGDLVHTERTTGRVPLAVWHRAGLAVDAEANLDVMAECMAIFEALLGPYPFDRYSVVLVPQYGGGMENATITFNSELSGQGNPSVGLHAHELAHQWYGDWVTMATYQDVWVKEGMATLLAAEATRGRRDLEERGRLFGTDFSFDAEDAIVDPLLTGLAKYTSGPYQRAAWVLTQIRSIVGEAAFWASVRQVLADHALGTIDGESFVHAFAPALDNAAVNQVLGVLQLKEVPSVTIGATPVAEGFNLSLILGDPFAALIAPIDVTVVDAAGAAVVHRLQHGVQKLVLVPTGGYVAPDEQDVHPYWTSSFDVVADHFNSALRPLMLPTDPDALAAFATRSASHQERTFVHGGLATMTAATFADVHADLDSSIAQREAAWDGCSVLYVAPPETIDAWKAALGPIVDAPATPSYSTRYGRCGVALATATLGDELTALGTGTTPADLTRLEYLIGFDYGAATSLERIGALATGSASLRLRDQAVSRLTSQTSGTVYSAIPDGEKESWRVFFRARLDEATASTRFRTVWRAIWGLGDTSALPDVAEKLHTVPMTSFTQRTTVCEVRLMTGDTASWTTFQAAAQPWDQLSDAAAAVLANPALCQ